MFERLSNWYTKKFTTKDVAVLLALLFCGAIIITYFGRTLAPVLASLVIAFLLDSIVEIITEKLPLSRITAVLIVYLFFMALFIAILLWLLPILIKQLEQLIQMLPNMMNTLRDRFLQLAHNYPQIIRAEKVHKAFNTLSNLPIERLTTIGRTILNYSLSSIPGLLTYLIYLFLVPLLVFFFLKDKHIMINWLSTLLPSERSALEEAWHELKPDLTNYVKGKAIEMLIVTVVSYITFLFFGVNYTALLAVGIGLSVFIPYIGMIVITVPVAIIGLMQFGFTATFFKMMSAYALIQAIEGNILVPILQAGTVNIHPVAIIISMLIFGSIWGFWGIFFSVPLASLMKVTLNVWIRYSNT
jgi:putative permease